LKSVPKTIGKHEIVIDSRIISYTLKKSLRSRLIWLKIGKETGLVVTVPRYIDITTLESFIKAKSKWILKTLAKIEVQQKKDTQITFNKIKYLGVPVNVIKLINNKKVAEIKLAGNRLIVDLDPSLRKKPDSEVEEWLKKQALACINRKTQYYSEKMGLKYNKIYIRSQKSRWGSCSRKGNLSFNWRLIMAPEPVLDYVVIHELAHLKEMNHSPDFWSLVDCHCADSKKYRKWLNKHSNDLHASIRIKY
jgi:predicted metal-dependent hydrolase